ncbi:hypothetical protein NL676_037876 [Syzygium grande]|nr:hypothetical protein NL676_037876 [Syzygium grande]
MSLPLHLKNLIYLLLLHFCSLQASTANSDVGPLLAFKAAFDTDKELTNWNSSVETCWWLCVSRLFHCNCISVATRAIGTAVANYI